MIERPVILLTFANQQDAYLDYLKNESKRLNYILSTHHDKGTIEVFREESSTVDDIKTAIERFDKRIAIFHYGGHADGGSLRFEGGDGNAAGLAELLGQLPNLKLVFLNGCSTQAQVKFLLDNGVKAVIATAVSINDEKAVVFAEDFYRAFSNGHTIGSAFRRAVANMKFAYGGDFGATIVRKGEAVVHADEEKMPWGLYLNDDSDDALNWEMPTYYPTDTTKTEAIDKEKFKVNMHIEDVIYPMFDIKPELEALCAYEDDEELDPRAVLLQIIQNFPWPIGAQIRLLVAKDGDMDTPSVERLKQIVSVYSMTSQFLFYIVMSQMWDEKRAATFNSKGYLVDMLYINKKQFGQFDYFKNFIDGTKLLMDADCEPVIKDFLTVVEDFDAHSELYEAYLYLESIRSAIHTNNMEVLEAKTYEKCVEGEYYLSTILYHLAFMIKYDLVTVRDIHVVNHRNMDTEFNHFISRLNVKVGDIAVSEGSKKIKARIYKTFTNNSSVILTSNIQDPSTFLNLSPFIIDKNAFRDGLTEDRATEQQLFMYAHREDGEDPKRDYQYYATFHNIYVAKERVSDQFLINAAVGAAKDSEESNTRSTRSRRSSRRRRRSTTTTEVINPYAVLKQQFEILERDLIR
ncbi:CHAT domain-containing protein [Aureispira anguillae]|uniref:CHAT domain-containing protein n=1 Tax=Aureispira anguillae TaxID=2864201 RepID=A0A915VMP3_9BACT|nr:CHAT domain-containing protein [Aureispira anguillae]BDS09444.1 CHAT domain-containing protein [Aureispira anguillae]